MNGSRTVEDPDRRSLTQEQVRLLLHPFPQSSHEQGLRDALIMCLLINERLPLSTIAQLRAEHVMDLHALCDGNEPPTHSVLALPSGDEEITLSAETVSALREYARACTPVGMLLAGSVANGELHASIGASAISARVRVLGERVGCVNLTPSMCRHARDAELDPPIVRRRQIYHNRSCSATSRPTAVPLAEVTDTLMGALGDLEACLTQIREIQVRGNLTTRFERLCAEAEGQCARLGEHLAQVQAALRLLPLHTLLLRLFPRLEETGLSEAALQLLEGAVVASLARGKELPQRALEERAAEAGRQCLEGLGIEVGGEIIEALLTQVVTAALLSRSR